MTDLSAQNRCRDYGHLSKDLRFKTYWSTVMRNLPSFTASERKSHSATWLLLAALMIVVGEAHASLSVREEYSEVIRKTREISPFGIDFGEKIDHASGTVEFGVTDVELKGNNALPVSVRRRYVPDAFSPTAFYSTQYHFGDWELDVPYLHGVFAESVGWANARCSGPTSAAGMRPSDGGLGFSSYLFWHGSFVHVPGEGSSEILFRPQGTKGRMPQDGRDYRFVTKRQWFFACLASMKNGQGEGFFARSPDGVSYYFDWMVDYSAIGVTKPGKFPDLTQLLPRKQVRIYPTRMVDRFGNSVDYTWEGKKLKSIVASDGRRIDLEHYSDGKIKRAVTGSKAWDYMYASSNGGTTLFRLERVENPDDSYWQYTSSPHLWVGNLYDTTIDYSYCSNPNYCTRYVMDELLDCSWRRRFKNIEYSLTVRSPSGAQAIYRMQPKRQARTNVPRICIEGNWDRWDPYLAYNLHPVFYDTLSLIEKRVTGPGLAELKWSFSYSTPTGSYEGETSTAATTKRTIVVSPDQTITEYVYGKNYRVDENQLLKVITYNAGVNQTVAYGYVTSSEVSGHPFPDAIGVSGQLFSDVLGSSSLRPIKSVVTTQDGVQFSSLIIAYTDYAAPTSVTKSSTIAGNPSKTEVTTYHDNTAKWVIGQVASVKCTASVPASGACNGDVVSQTTYDTTYALPLTSYAFGKLQHSLTYDTASTVASGQRGTLKTVSDGRDSSTFNTTITLSNWKRGIPQKVAYPATPDQPTAVSQSAIVNDDGTIASVTDENGYKTCYAYDAMGRVNRITYPSETQVGVCDTSAWNPTTITFAAGNPAAYGMPAGHWRQTTLTGRGRKIVIYDALWRPVAEQTLDLDRTSSTVSEVFKRYDAAGRLAFQSYPMNSNGTAVYTNPALKGTKYSYDALDRPLTVVQDSELGPLTTRTEYLSGFQTRVTNPRGKQTLTTLYMAFDEPTYDLPLGINHPEGAYTSIYRNVFGNPYAIARFSAGNSVRQTRWYVYDAHQQLCKTIDDETGATVIHYDGAGNIDWSGSGLNAVGSTTDCQHDHATVAARKITRTYDARNRLKTLSFPNGLGDQTWTWTPDGLPASVLAQNGSGAQPTTTTYAYNRRRLLEYETLKYGSVLTWPVDYAYNANGHLAAQRWHGLNVDYTPNALGQASKAGVFASGVSYHPNGAIKQFTYGNGIVHTLTQNVRGLPDTSRDAHGSTAFLDDGYDYDQNGNIAAITDGATGRNQRGNRTMVYDGLDRLTQAVSPMFGTATYTYDVLDNLTRAKVTGGSFVRDHHYCHNGDRHVDFVRNGPVCTGSNASPAVLALEYDVQGNLKERNSTSYAFDFGNRLRTSSASNSRYAYDGLGRRVWDATSAGSKYSQYLQNGQLSMTADARAKKNSEYIYLQGSLVAIRERDTTTNVHAVKYQHTDALGSPVVVTGADRAVVERTEYEPYGRVVNRPLHDGPGYTGHVEDKATVLVYMQQRYYDWGIGRFLSVDPVTALTDGDMRHFNRYTYAYNNPYKFIDQDGRQSVPFVPDPSNQNHANMIQSQVDRAQASQITKAAQFEAMKYENRQAGLHGLAATSGMVSIASVKVPPVSITAGVVSLLSGGAAFIDSEINGKSSWVDRTLFAITTSPYGAALRLTRLAELAKPVELAQSAGGVAGSASSAVAAGVNSNRSEASPKATQALQGIPINRIQGRADSNRLREQYKR